MTISTLISSSSCFGVSTRPFITLAFHHLISIWWTQISILKISSTRLYQAVECVSIYQGRRNLMVSGMAKYSNFQKSWCAKLEVSLSLGRKKWVHNCGHCAIGSYAPADLESKEGEILSAKDFLGASEWAVNPLLAWNSKANLWEYLFPLHMVCIWV